MTLGTAFKQVTGLSSIEWSIIFNKNNRVKFPKSAYIVL